MKTILIKWLTLLTLLTMTHQVAAKIALSERAALISLYDLTAGDQWKNNKDWLGEHGTECHWFGVTCQGDHVTMLMLTDNQLIGSIPPELSQLSKLTHLSLNANVLVLSIPPELGHLQQLKRLSLQNNQLTGSIPVELGQLSHLMRLSLSENQLTGDIPAELAQIPQLEWFVVYQNCLTASDPALITFLDSVYFSTWRDQRTDCPKQALKIPLAEREALLALYESTQGDKWPDNLGWLSPHGTECHWSRVVCQNGLIVELQLTNNQLTGSIPPELGQLSQLKELLLSSNQLKGIIPPELGQLSQLKRLDIRQNELTGVIPSEFGGLLQLEELDIGKNHLTGNIPVELGQLSQLKFFNVYDNQLKGIVPLELAHLSSLQGLTLSQNCLTFNNIALTQFFDAIEYSRWKEQRTEACLISYPQPALAIGSFAEPNNTSKQAVSILVNDYPQYQLLDHKGDVDWFKFYSEKGSDYTISVPQGSVGIAIDPILSLLDETGNVIETVNNNSKGQSEKINWTATETALFYIRVTHNDEISTQDNFLVADHTYNMTIALSDPQKQGVIKGFVFDFCRQIGVVDASALTLSHNNIIDSSATHKTGLFAIPVTLGEYSSSVPANDYLDQESKPLDINLSPRDGCLNNPNSKLLSQQTAIGHYNDKTGKLIIKDVYVQGKSYYAELQHQGNNQFSLSQYIQLSSTIHSVPANYNIESPLVMNIPTVFAYGKVYKVQMKNNGQWLFSLTEAIEEKL